LLRFARTHAPFSVDEAAARFGLGYAQVDEELQRLVRNGRLLEGAFRPGGSGAEFSDPEVLRQIRRRSLAKLRAQIEPVEPRVLGRFLTAWQGLIRKRKGLDAVLDVVEQLQGLALPASLLESEILPARVDGYLPGDLDALASAGEVIWLGIEPIGERDGRIALYLADHFAKLRRPRELIAPPQLELKEQEIIELLQTHGASFFPAIHEALGGFEAANLDALWSLVWKGLVTNDSFRALRAYSEPPARTERRERIAGRAFRSRRSSPPQAEGRWSLIESRSARAPSVTEWSSNIGQQLLVRYGVVTREVAQSEGIFGGFSAVYDVFKLLEESGKIRRGYFVSNVGAAQFALPAVLDQLRALRDDPLEPEVLLLAATDPGNPYGSILKWPELEGRGPQRATGAHVVLVNGALAAFAGKGARQLWLFLPESEPDRSTHARAVAVKLWELAARQRGRHEGLLVEEINGRPAHEHFAVGFFTELGFTATSHGLQLRRVSLLPTTAGPRHA
jgi:ATP-dependent helicase Lhr and Lhr-like helicase